MKTKLLTRACVLIALFFSILNLDAQIIRDTTGKNNPAKQSKESDLKEKDKNKDKDKDAPKSDKCIKKFKTLTDTYYGYPAFYGYIMQLFVDHGTIVKMLGPTGGKFEVLLTDKFGIGTEVNYTTSSILWDNIKQDAAGNNIRYHCKYSSTAVRSMMSFNFHFATKKRVDWYTSVKAGYFTRSYKWDNGGDKTAEEPKIDPIWKSNDWHVALRWEIGCRLFLAKFMAVNFSFGIGGGPIVSSGASSKF